MNRALRILLVEDSQRDAELLLRELRRGNFETTYRRVDTEEAMKDALATETWDVITSDYNMPEFSASRALKVLQDSGLDIPFIVISGALGEEKAVEVLRAGAHDFMAKGSLSRLLPALDRELREVGVRNERRKMKEQLMVSDRMASVGTLAAGVAHEINNPLAAVIANLQLAVEGITELATRQGPSVELDVLREELQDATHDAERIRDIVRDLRIFSRSESETTGPVDVQQVMESTLRMASNELRHRARIVKLYEQVSPVDATESRLGQVFLNLVINAAQAIPEGRSDSNEIRVCIRSGVDGRVVVEVSDTGPGIPEPILKKLFTPFFTTKPAGVGTGLGLSICERIVTGFGGSIEVESQLGKGTVFRVSLLPARNAAPAAPATTTSVSPAVRRGKILVVDDEPAIARAVRRILARDHEIVMIDNAGLALDRIRGGERFDLILCDLMMPQMTGMDLHAALLQIAPDQAEAMIFVTGGAFTPNARAFLAETPNLRVEKPFEATELRALVNDRIR